MRKVTVGTKMDSVAEELHGKRVIVIASYGWVFTGYRAEQDTDHVLIEKSDVIRVWGTTNGLGQLALSGPQSETVLDPCGTVDLPVTSVIAVIECPGWA
jgi:hypothetical protein